MKRFNVIIIGREVQIFVFHIIIDKTMNVPYGLIRVRLDIRMTFRGILGGLIWGMESNRGFIIALFRLSDNNHESNEIFGEYSKVCFSRAVIKVN